MLLIPYINGVFVYNDAVEFFPKTESVDINLVVQEHPVESLATISDNAYLDPKKVDFTLSITDVYADAVLTKSALDRMQEIKNLQEEKTPIFWTGYGATIKMSLVKNFKHVTDTEISNGFRCTFTLQEIKTATSQTTTEEVVPDTKTTNKDGTVKDQGTASTTEKQYETVGYKVLFKETPPVK